MALGLYCTDNNSDLSPTADGTSLSLISNAVCRAATLVSSAYGTQEVSFTHPATANTLIYWEYVTDANALDFMTWGASSSCNIYFTVPTTDRDLEWNYVYVQRLSSDGTFQANIGSAVNLFIQLTGTTYFSTQITLAAQTYSAGDRIRVVFGVRNTTTKNQTIGIAPYAGITMLTSSATGYTDPVWTQTDFRWRNDDGDEDAATWKQNANTNITETAGTKRVRFRVTNTGAGVSKFGLQSRRVPIVTVDNADNSSVPLYGYGSGAINYQAVAQSFQYGAALSLNEVWLKLFKVGSPTDNLYIECQSSIGGTVLGTSDNVAGSTVPSVSGGTWVKFRFSTPISLSASTPYYLVLERSSSRDESNYYLVYETFSSVYGSGVFYGYNISNTWVSDANADLKIYINGSPWAALPAQGTSNVPLRFANSTNITDAEATTPQISEPYDFTVVAPDAGIQSMKYAFPVTGFTAITNVRVKIKKTTGTPTQDMTLEIAATYDGTALATSSYTLAAANVPDDGWVDFPISLSGLTAGNTYWIRALKAAADTTYGVSVYSSSSSYYTTWYWTGAVWASSSNYTPGYMVTGTQSGLVAAGKMYESNHANTMTLSSPINAYRGYVELEAVIEVVSGEVSDSEEYELRVVREV